MDESSFMAVVQSLLTDHEYQNVNVRTNDLWMLMCACQTMMTLPNLSPASHTFYKDLGMRLQAIVVHIHPEAKELAARGWDTFVPSDDDSGPENPLSFWARFSDEGRAPYTDEDMFNF